MAGYVRYDTRSEESFIRRLGEHSKAGQDASLKGPRAFSEFRIGLLESYLSTLRTRRNPDRLDFDRCREVAEEELERERKALARCAAH
jgi:hypothetical protein